MPTLFLCHGASGRHMVCNIWPYCFWEQRLFRTQHIFLCACPEWLLRAEPHREALHFGTICRRGNWKSFEHSSRILRHQVQYSNHDRNCSICFGSAYGHQTGAFQEWLGDDSPSNTSLNEVCSPSSSMTASASYTRPVLEEIHPVRKL